jgi:hypothetical protein
VTLTTTPKKAAGPDFRYVRPAKRRPTQYEEVTLHTQWDPKNFAKQGWFSPSSDGRPMWDENSTRLRAANWWGYRDPAQQWFRPYVEHQARQEEAIELAVEGAKRTGLFTELTPQWKAILANYYAAYRYLEYGFFLSFCYVQREALSDVVATPLVFEGLDKDRHAQAIALYGMDLEEAIPAGNASHGNTPRCSASSACLCRRRCSHEQSTGSYAREQYSRRQAHGRGRGRSGGGGHRSHLPGSRD